MDITLTETEATMRVLLAVLAVLLPGCLCTPQAVCSPATCTGCCDASSTCQPGTTSTACGKTANACGACTSGQTCQAQVCTATVVGLWPSVVFDSTGKLYFVYRDADQAQFATQDRVAA